ncbi:MAG: hypothetical protein K0S45_2005 [Nitrospira sp.]|jgi:hypothetical protein|nr:hypothetical protein [Nitrospira sp.]
MARLLKLCRFHEPLQFEEGVSWQDDSRFALCIALRLAMLAGPLGSPFPLPFIKKSLAHAAYVAIAGDTMPSNVPELSDSRSLNALI